MKTRIISGLFIAFFVILVVYLGDTVLQYSLMALSLIGLHEFYKAMNGKHLAINYISYGFTICYYILIGLGQDFSKFLMPLLLVYTLILFSYLVLTYPKININNVAISLLGVMYIPIMFSYVYQIRMLEQGLYLVWFVFITAFATDTFAYFTGVFFGKHKLIPHLSPNKTIEGSVGGILGCVILCVAFSGFLSTQMQLESFNFILIAGMIGLFCSIFAQFGDLTASSVKRLTGVKDFGNLIPGHGGVIDRFDSILFTAPILFIVLQII